MYHKAETSPDGAWSHWFSIGGKFMRVAPAVAANADGRLELFAVGTGGALYHSWQITPGGNWSDWVNEDGHSALTAGPALILDPVGRLELFIVGMEGAVYMKQQVVPGGGWTGWVYLGGSNGSGVSKTAPAVAVSGFTLTMCIVANNGEVLATT